MAAARNSLVKASSANLSASLWAALSASSSASFFSKAAWMAISLRASGVMPPRGGDDASMASRRRSGAVDAAAAMNHKGTPRDAPLGLVDLSRTVGVDLRQSRAQSPRHEHVLQEL